MPHPCPCGANPNSKKGKSKTQQRPCVNMPQISPFKRKTISRRSSPPCHTPREPLSSHQHQTTLWATLCTHACCGNLCGPKAAASPSHSLTHSFGWQFSLHGQITRALVPQWKFAGSFGAMGFAAKPLLRIWERLLTRCLIKLIHRPMWESRCAD